MRPISWSKPNNNLTENSSVFEWWQYISKCNAFLQINVYIITLLAPLLFAWFDKTIQDLDSSTHWITVRPSNTAGCTTSQLLEQSVGCSSLLVHLRALAGSELSDPLHSGHQDHVQTLQVTWLTTGQVVPRHLEQWVPEPLQQWLHLRGRNLDTFQLIYTTET